MYMPRMNAPVVVRSADRDEPRKHLLRVEDFILLQDRGVFDRYAKAELIEGDIYTVNAIYRPHAGISADLVIDLGNAIRGSGLSLKVYSPVSARLDDHSLPEPDIVIATIEPEKMIVKESVRLAVEVSDSTLDFDLKRKVPLYAKAGIAELWIVDVAGRKIIRMAEPIDGAYRAVEEFVFGSRIACATIPQIAIDTTYLA